MKNRKLALIFSFIAMTMIAAMVFSFAAFAEGEAVVLGDVNGDKVVGGEDVVLLSQYFAAYDYDTKTPGVEINTANANMDGDEDIDLVDLNLLRMMLAEKPCDHEWVDATCTAPKTCSACGATEGEAAGHTWADADCDTPKTCSVCQATEGEANGHVWADATCTAPKTCSVCQATEGEAAGHTWTDADCDTPKTCSVCQATEGEALGHTHVKEETTKPTCTEPGLNTFTCACGDSYTEDVDALGHNWADADCTTPKTCSVCQATDGEALGHSHAEEIVTAPTCTTAGSAKYTCACGDTYTKDRDALGHKDEDGDFKCDNEGCTENVLPAADSTLTIEQAIAIGKLFTKDKYTTDKYYITGTVTKIDNATYGNTTITDGTNSILVYGTYSADGNTQYGSMTVKHVVGDTITVYGIIGFYNDAQMKDGWVTELVAHEHTYSFDCDTVCDICGDDKREDAGEHAWVDATCTAPKTCSACGAKEGDSIDHTYVDGVCSCGKEQPVEVKQETLTITFDNTNKCIESSTSKQVWTENGIVLTNDKANATNNVAVYVPIRCYKGSTITIEYPGMTKIVLYCSGADYDGGMTASVGTVTTDGNNTIITFAEPVDSVTITAAANQVRFNKIEVTANICNHENTEPVEAVDPTCTTVGYTEGTKCTNCGRIVTGVEEVEKLPHTEEIIPAVDPNCTEPGTTAGVKCSVCGTVIKDPATVAPDGHIDEDSDNACDVCGADMSEPSAPAEPQSLAKFELGANGSASHNDGSEKTTYSETNNGYTLSLTSMSKVYSGARDAKGNSCLKLGTSSAAGKFSFTVDENVTSVIIYVAKYKTNTAKYTINGGATQTLTKNSNNGEYDAIVIDTTTTKTITFATVSGGYRCMVNSIEFIGYPN